MVEPGSFFNPRIEPVIVLIHSPLVGPFTWALVAERLRERQLPVVVPGLDSNPSGSRPYWMQHAGSVADALSSILADQPVLLVGHSGAGPLLPAIRQVLNRPVAGYLFVDAGWPADGKSRLDQFEDAEAAQQFRQSAQDGLLPVWTDEDLRPVIPDDTIRRRFASELRPLPLRVYEEPLPVFPGWPDAPCGYLRFGSNPAYDRSADQALQAGFRVMQLEGDHFHMLVDPGEVAGAMLELIQRMR